MPFGDERQVRCAEGGAYGSAIENGPPDTETLDRRRVDPPAGCRVATEPAIVLTRRSVDEIPSYRHRPSACTDGRGIEPLAQLACLVGQLVRRDLGAEVGGERPEELQRSRRVGPGDVVRN